MNKNDEPTLGLSEKTFSATHVFEIITIAVINKMIKAFSINRKRFYTKKVLNNFRPLNKQIKENSLSFASPVFRKVIHRMNEALKTFDLL